ncbi:MAG: phenylacetic acid degradation operon negative regulatory protein [Oceanospirillaceae bacterium]
MTDKNKRTKKIQQHIKDSTISCTSMVVTVFGDVVSQHGSWVSLASLIQVLEPFGFNERQIRTSVYRLVQNNWLQVNKVGRCSYYCFTDTATGHYEKAARRIYAVNQPEWDNNWTLVLPVSVPDMKLEEFRKSLIWQGFNTVTSGLYAHPSSERSSLDELIHELGIVNDLVVFSASTSDLNSQGVLKDLIKNRWKLSELETYYKDFLFFYRPICQKIFLTLPDPGECLLLRQAMIHDYRRILLRDPDFPAAMLPPGWVGHEAQDLVKRAYKVLAESSIYYISQKMKNAQGPMPEPNKRFFTRFGGLKPHQDY